MVQLTRRWLVLSSAGALTLLACGPVVDSAPEEDPGRPLARLEAAIRAEGTVRAVVMLRAPAAPEAARALPRGATLRRSFTALPGMVVELTSAEAARALAADPAVASIELDVRGQAQLLQAVSAVGAPAVHGLGYDGTGVLVAVLDSGVDVSHPDLAGAIAAEHCFTDGACPPGNTDESTSAQDENGHGTHIASIITSAGVHAWRGVADGSRIVAVRVLDSNGGGWVSDWILALDWILANHTQFPVRVVNMSVATTSLYAGTCDATFPSLTAAVSALEARGILVVASSGNNGGTGQIGAPACITGVLAVGASYDANLGREPDVGTYREWFNSASWPTCADASTSTSTVACFSNLSSRVDLVAPGAQITASLLNGTVTAYHGTSQAAAVASGAAALLAECRPGLPPADLRQALRATGPRLADSRTGLLYPRLDVAAAAQTLCVSCQARPDGSPCSDGLFCNGEDRCQAGSCSAHTALPCDDGLTCTTDQCTESTRACAHTLSPGFCVVDGACVPAGPVAGGDGCTGCAPGTSTTQLVRFAEGTPCPVGECDARGVCVSTCGCAAGGPEAALVQAAALAVAVLWRRRRRATC
jgi:MYXO-CTERM domain-containing protein